MGRQISVMLRLRRTNRAAVQRVRYVLRKMTYPQNEQIEYNTYRSGLPDPARDAAMRRRREVIHWTNQIDEEDLFGPSDPAPYLECRASVRPCVASANLWNFP